MSLYSLKIHLLSDTTFGRGDGVAGLLDQEVEHDAYGFPYLRGRTLKGLIREECDNLAALLSHQGITQWMDTSKQLFGDPGSTLESIAAIHIGDACLAKDLRGAVALQFRQQNSDSKIKPQDVLASLTTIRRQTALDSVKGVAKDRSLRSSRVVLRSLCFKSDMVINRLPEKTQDFLALLAAGTKALRRVGSDRNRGRGHVQCTLWQGDRNITDEYLTYFFEGKIQ
jgi:CRISPR/Cas system CSM-associated protein Csm3 (group 7 of RAMP superfamily)